MGKIPLKVLINTKIKSIVCGVDYREDENAANFLKAANIEIQQCPFYPHTVSKLHRLDKFQIGVSGQKSTCFIIQSRLTTDKSGLGIQPQVGHI